MVPHEWAPELSPARDFVSAGTPLSYFLPPRGRLRIYPGMQSTWDMESVLALGRSYQGAAVLGAAADLEIFDHLQSGASTVNDLADRMGCDPRGLTVLLDALVALDLLHKSEERYELRPDVAPLLTRNGPQSVLAMAQHQANCLRRWAQLAAVVKTGQPPPELASIRGEQGDLEAFIGAMDNVSAPVADEVIRAVDPLTFEHLLDIGGASGTWTAAFLRACPGARATLFDLPEVIPLARERLSQKGILDRVNLVAGDYNRDSFPDGVDLAWVSAIVHQNSREQNRELFRKAFAALVPGGRIAIRDIIMEPDRTRPVSGALFAVNMLVGTERGATFTFDELRSDLENAGFSSVVLARPDQAMNAVLVALKP